ncbi:MAG: NAD(P)-binding domain-containing protein [Bacteroidales bacterium]|nr:NAD(P)-binding domain-containing protein [Bacteroidales bacterium]
MGFIGGGRITKIILQAFQNQNVTFEKIVVTDTNQEVLNSLKKKFPDIIITDNLLEATNNEVVFVALHPPVFMETIGKVKDILNKNSIVVSLAPKLTIEK